MHCHLTFEEDDNSSMDSNPLPGSMEQCSPTEHPMACHLTSPDKEEEEEDEEEEEEEEHFSTAPLSDDIWMEEPVPDRHVCICEHSEHDLCPYPCPYSLDQLHLAPEYTPMPQYIDLSDIFHFPDVITTTSNKDIPNLEDVLVI